MLIFCSGECFYCKHGFTSRCAKSQLFGTAGLDGGQAEYVGHGWNSEPVSIAKHAGPRSLSRFYRNEGP